MVTRKRKGITIVELLLALSAKETLSTHAKSLARKLSQNPLDRSIASSMDRKTRCRNSACDST